MELEIFQQPLFVKNIENLHWCNVPSLILFLIVSYIMFCSHLNIHSEGFNYNVEFCKMQPTIHQH